MGSVRSIWIRGGGGCRAGRGHGSRHSVPRRRHGRNRTRHRIALDRRRPAASDLAAGRAARRRRVRVRRLAGRRRAVVVAGAAAGPARRARLAVHGAVGVRRLARRCSPTRSAGAATRRRRRSVRAHAYWIGDWVASPGGDAGRPGALRPRVGGAARATPPSAACGCIGDVPIYVAPGRRRPPRAPGAVPAGVVAGVPPDAYTDDGPALGQPALRLAGAAAPGLPLVGRSGCGATSSCSTRAHRPLPRLRRLLGGPGRRPRPRAAARWQRGPGAARFEAARRQLGGRCRWSPRTSASSPRRSTGCATSSGFPGMVVLQFGFGPATRARRTGPRTTPRHRSSTPARTTTTPAAGWWDAASEGEREEARAAFARAGVAEPEPHWALIDAHAALAGRAGDRRRPRTSSGWAPRRG